MKPLRTGLIALAALLPVALGIFLLRPAAARAAGAPCVITSADLDAITTAAQSGLLAELAARRAFLTQIVSCAKTDTQTLQDNLNALSVSGDSQAIQSQLSGKLSDALTYYDLELGKVPGAGIAGTQAIAKEVLGWRASNYEPLAGQVENFTLWVNNQDLFKAANDRLGGIANIVSFLEQAGQNNELQNDLAAAQALMQTANSENSSAKNALLQSFPPGESLSLIQQSLQSLSDAYQKFFDIATAAQGLLSPTNK